MPDWLSEEAGAAMSVEVLLWRGVCNVSSHTPIRTHRHRSSRYRCHSRRGFPVLVFSSIVLIVLSKVSNSTYPALQKNDFPAVIGSVFSRVAIRGLTVRTAAGRARGSARRGVVLARNLGRVGTSACRGRARGLAVGAAPAGGASGAEMVLVYVPDDSRQCSDRHTQSGRTVRCLRPS